MSSADDIHQAALRYVDAGISVIPIVPDGTKSPASSMLPKVWCEAQRRYRPTWNEFKTRRPDLAELDRWFRPSWPVPLGMAAVCGAVSGGLENIDLDNAGMIMPWATQVDRAAPGLLDRLVLVATPRPGLHAYFRSPCCMPSDKLASIMVVDPADGKEKPKVVIETKGEGGYCVVPPTPPGMHLTGRPYVFLDGRDLTAVSMISADERRILIDAAKALNRIPPRQPRPASRRRQNLGPVANLPGDDFNARASWGQILEPRGWQLVSGDGVGESQWRRPGKAVGISATTNVVPGDCLYVFTDNAAPFEMEQAYTKFAAFALLYHGGDFSAAAKMLRERGYGGRRR